MLTAACEAKDAVVGVLPIAARFAEHVGLSTLQRECNDHQRRNDIEPGHTDHLQRQYAVRNVGAAVGMSRHTSDPSW
jgi:hypothetical protein